MAIAKIASMNYYYYYAQFFYYIDFEKNTETWHLTGIRATCEKVWTQLSEAIFPL